MEIRTKGKQCFNVPNTRNGQAFIRNLKKFSNSENGVYLKVRGRTPKKDGGWKNRSDLPLDESKWLAVYVNKN